MQEYLQNLSIKIKVIIGIAILCIMIFLFILAYKLFYTDNTEEIELTSQNYTNNIEENNDESVFKIETEKHNVTVHVVGEVNSPGVYTLNEGARIIDAIKEAGNKTEDADLSKINLAYILEDGIQIYIPRVGENKEDLIIEDAGEGIITESSSIDNNEIQNSKVNINTASQEKLQTLPGVGNSTAQKIIDYRNENGKFKTEEDIKNVPGIGEAKYNSLKDKIVVK